MTRVVLLHGTLGQPEGNWFRWLEEQLQAKGVEVWLPQLPHAEQPSLSEWIDFVHRNCPFALDENTIIVGHSSGAVLALALAQENQTKLKSVICVSVFTNEWGESTAIEWPPNARLFDVKFDWGKIRNNTSTTEDRPLNQFQNEKHAEGSSASLRVTSGASQASSITLVHSDDDPYIPLEQADWIAEKLKAELIVIPGQGHFNLEKSPDYTAFPALLALVESNRLL
jgi:uncharacterized protein